MPQTVFYVGNPITSRLRLGVTPGGDTVTTLNVYRPDGAGDEKTAQFYATDDGAAAGTVAAAAGDWLVLWKVTGTGATVAPKVYSVAPLPGTSRRPPWSPFLSDVAKHIIRFTIDVINPGMEIPLGTFTGATNPTDEQAQDHIDEAAAGISARLGVMGEGSYPLAGTVTALRAAAAIARGFARSAQDIATADALDRRADAELEALIAVDAITSSPDELFTGRPYWSFPDPPAWADTNI
jgi:hypothetical protein